MSADDFQTKYASVMESMLKSAIAETTKLFETMVDDLKAEISRIKKENEDLRTRCSQFENGKSQPTASPGESEPLPPPSNGSGKRDTAVQCDLAPFHAVLVGQCQPLKNSLPQNQQQQCHYEAMEYGLPLINQESLPGEMPEKDGETRVAIEQPYLGMESDLQGAQNQSSEPEHSLVISFSAIKDDTKETKGELVTSEEQPTTKEQPSVVPQQRQREGVASVNEQTVVTLQQYADVHCTEEQLADPTPQNKEVAHVELKNGTTEGEASFQPTRRKRGRPPKKGKRLKKPVKEILETSSTDVTAEQEMVNSPSVEEVEEVVVSSAVNTVNTTASESSQAFPVECKKISSIIIPSVQESTSTALGDVENCEVGSSLVSVASLTRSCSSMNEKSSESKQLSTEMEAPSTEVSSATTMPNSPPAESPQAPPVQLRAHNTFVTLQNAMLMVEAMNQSTGENTVSTPKRMAAPSQNQCAPPVGALKIVDEVPTKPQTLQLPTETLEAAGSPPITELSTTQLTVKTLGASPQVPDSTSTKEAQALIKVVIPKRQYAVTPSNTVTPPMPLSAATTQTSAQSQLRLPQPLITSVAPSKPTNAVPPKISVVPRSVPSFKTHKIAALSQTQLSTFVSTVAAAQSNSLLPASTAAGLPLGMPSSSSVPQKTIYVTSRKSFPVVHRQLSNKSTDQQSGILPPPKITIIIPRQVSAVASRTHQPQTIVLTTKQESAEPAADVKVPSSPLCSSSMVSVGEQATSDVATISPKKRDNATNNLESPEQSASVCETTNAPAETFSGLKMSVPTGPLPASLYAVDQKLSAMVRLTRLPLSVSTKESVLLSRVLSNGCSETQSVVKEGTTHEKLSSVVISTQPSEMPVVSTDICPSLKETSVSVNTPQMSEKQNNIKETALLSSGKNAIYVQSFTPPKVSSPLLEKPAVAISTAEPSAGEPASSLEEEIIRNAVQVCALPDDPTTEEKQSPAVMQLTSITSKDTSDPHLQMSKIQFLAQLAVSPIVQAPEEASSNDSAHTRACSAETSNSGKKGLQENSLVARLQGHLKAHLQTRRTEPNPEPCAETETTSVSTKKLELDNHSPNDRNTASEPVLISLKKSGVAEDVTSSNKATNGPIPYSPKSIGLCKGTVRSKRSVSETSRSSKATSESTPVSGRRSSSGRNGVNVKFTSFSIQRSCSTKDGASPKKTKNGASLKNKKSTSVSTKMTSLTRDYSKVKQTQSTFMSTKLIQGSFSPRSSAVAKTQRETGSPSVRWPKLAKDGVSPRETGESTPAKKPRLIHDVTNPKTNLRVLNAKKLAKAAKATTIAKMKNPTKLQNGAKSSHLAENQNSCEAEKKYTAKAVWIPPQMPTSKALSAGGKRSSLFLVKKETRSSRSQDHTVSYPPSVSLHPIPVKAPPIVSPLQPLSVIGGRLLKNQCGECGRVLSSGAALESHVSLHTGCRPFSCTLCGKSFPDAKGLKRHGRVHRNGRIHVCQQCGKGFVYRFGLTKHLQMVHSRLKPFVCQICNKGFFTKRDVEAHIRIHTGEKPFHCNLCDKKFTRRVELNVHLRWHNGEKRHWCPYCGKGFLDFNNLKRHKYIHTGEKPHSCPHCPKHFTQSGHLKKHVKNVHKIQ
ncbi:flocculation protein FLO11-like [Toxotes jaculatrix]|uniref:flocculation protein FLO11-like n=1 Tax=Toxotes jaculatrix TaxID=941984 RepID=UPI001B3A865B|nr:flocculation protein FLO11-like [Toxotes jaculatrix]